MVCSPHGKGGLEARGALIGNEQHAIERLDALQIEHIAIAVGQQHCPGQAIGIETIGIARRTGLAVHRTDLEQAFEGHRRSDARRPGTADGAELLVSRAHTFAATRMPHESYMREVNAMEERTGGIVIEQRKLLEMAKDQAPAPQVQATVSGYSWRRRHTAVCIDRNHD